MKPNLDLSVGATKLVGHFNSSLHREIVIKSGTHSPTPASGNRCISLMASPLEAAGPSR